MISKMVLGALVVAALLFPTIRATGGDRAGNGGDPLAAEFVVRGHFVLNALKAGGTPYLTSSELADFAAALRDTRIVLVDVPLPGRALSVVSADPTDRAHKLIRVYRKDWLASERLGVDLVQKVFHDYLLVVGKDDDDYAVSSKLSVTERDFKSRPLENPDCPGGRLESVTIAVNISASWAYLRYPSYVNGAEFETVPTSYRIYRSARLCNTKSWRFVVTIGDFTKALNLRGGESVTLAVPSGAVQ